MADVELHKLVLCEYRDEKGSPRRKRCRPEDVPEGAEIIEEPDETDGDSDEVESLRDEVDRLSAVAEENRIELEAATQEIERLNGLLDERSGTAPDEPNPPDSGVA